MSANKLFLTVVILIIGYAAYYPNETAAVTKKWHEEFTGISATGENALPSGWVLKNKPGTRPAIFFIERGKNNRASFLRMEADRASAAIVTRLNGVDLKKTPVLRWRWKALVLPEGADGRIKEKDDQAIGIYVGSGHALNNKSVSYRWDTETSKSAEGECVYGLGNIKVKWYTLRNKEDIKSGAWFIEERNIAEDFKKAWGFLPDEIYISVSCNSQYTSSRADAQLDWIELV